MKKLLILTVAAVGLFAAGCVEESAEVKKPVIVRVSPTATEVYVPPEAAPTPAAPAPAEKE
jgi:hypothetical protein